MRNLLNFIIKYNTWFVFTFFVLLSCMLLFKNNSYQQSIYLTSANSVSNSVYGVVNSIAGYFNLREINEDLHQRNALLENEVLNLKNQIAYYQTLVPADSNKILESAQRFDFITATVVNNSVKRPQNYFTLNKGANDGIKPGMGVVDQNGVVGIVNVVGKNSARVISLLNVTQHFSVKVNNTNSVGSLHWVEGNPNIAYVEEMPRHIKYHIGDTIVTSGYSTTFPEGIPVGTIISQIKTSDDNFFTLKIKLSSDFTQLSTVRILKDNLKAELDSLIGFDVLNDKNNS